MGWVWTSDAEGFRSKKKHGRKSDAGTSSGDKKKIIELEKKLKDKSGPKNYEPVAHLDANEGRPREGDWPCGTCGYSTNRKNCVWCHCCAHSKAGVPPQIVGDAIARSVQRQHQSTFSTSPIPTSTPALSTSASAIKSQNGNGGGDAAAVGGSAAVQAIKDDIKKLREYEGQLASSKVLLPQNASTHALLDQEISQVKLYISTLVPPEVAIRASCGPVAQARRLEATLKQRLEKLESEVVEKVHLADECRAKLSAAQAELQQAEASVARLGANVGGFVAVTDVKRALVEDPATSWSWFVEAIKARITDQTPTEVVDRLNRMASDLEIVKPYLPVAKQPDTQQPQQQHLQHQQAQAAALSPSASAALAARASAATTIASAPNLSQQLQAVEAEILNATRRQQELLQRAMAQESATEEVVQAAAESAEVAGTVTPVAPIVVAPSSGVGLASTVIAGDIGGVGASSDRVLVGGIPPAVLARNAPPIPSDDESMHGVVEQRKRSAEEALNEAKRIAAKAKARPGSAAANAAVEASPQE